MLGALALGQSAALLAFALLVRHNGWLYYQGGDETFYYTSSWVLAGGHVPDAAIGYGWSYLLTPIARVAGPNFLEALPVLVLVQTVLLLPVALYCVYAIAGSIGGRLVGYFAAAAWITTPFAAIPLWDDSYREKYVEQVLPQAFGLTGLADFPSLVCLLVAGALCVRALDRPQTAGCLLAGLAAGFAIGVKPANALFLAGPLLAFSAARRYRAGVLFCAGLAPCLLALAVWKYRGLGHLPVVQATPSGMLLGGLTDLPLGVGLRQYLDLDWSQLKTNYTDLRRVFWGVPLLQSLPLLGLVVATRRSWPKALLIAGWLGAFILVKGSSDQASIDDGSFFRLFMPGFPPLLILAALIPLLVPKFRREPLQPPQVRSGLVAVVFAALAFVPLLFFTTLPTLGRNQAVWYFGEHVLLPVDEEFRITAQRAGSDAIVSWGAQPSPGVRTFYRVFRSRPVALPFGPDLPPEREGIRCLDPSTTDYAGAADCRLEMSPVGETRSNRFVDRPPPGRWVYRVGLAANWRDDPALGDVLLISRAAQLRAPP